VRPCTAKQSHLRSAPGKSNSGRDLTRAWRLQMPRTPCLQLPLQPMQACCATPECRAQPAHCGCSPGGLEGAASSRRQSAWQRLQDGPSTAHGAGTTCTACHTTGRVLRIPNILTSYMQCRGMGTDADALYTTHHPDSSSCMSGRTPASSSCSTAPASFLQTWRCSMYVLTNATQVLPCDCTWHTRKIGMLLTARRSAVPCLASSPAEALCQTRHQLHEAYRGGRQLDLNRARLRNVPIPHPINIDAAAAVTQANGLLYDGIRAVRPGCRRHRRYGGC
jgi:hypothetical protein